MRAATTKMLHLLYEKDLLKTPQVCVILFTICDLFMMNVYDGDGRNKPEIYTRLVGLSFADWSPLLPYMADGTAHYAGKVGDTQQYDIQEWTLYSSECYPQIITIDNIVVLWSQCLIDGYNTSIGFLVLFSLVFGSPPRCRWEP